MQLAQKQFSRGVEVQIWGVCPVGRGGIETRDSHKEESKIVTSSSPVENRGFQSDCEYLLLVCFCMKNIYFFL